MIVEYATTTLRGLVDGKNKVFELSDTPVMSSLMVYQNGICLDPNYDNGWYMDGPAILSFAEAPQLGDTVVVAYDAVVPVVAPPSPPLPVPPEPYYPPLTVAEYGFAQNNYPPGGVASIIAPTIVGSSSLGVAFDGAADATSFALVPQIIQTQVF